MCKSRKRKSDSVISSKTVEWFCSAKQHKCSFLYYFVQNLNKFMMSIHFKHSLTSELSSMESLVLHEIKVSTFNHEMYVFADVGWSQKSALLCFLLTR